jgi:RND family efflux transporter MFP subunit
VFLISSGDALQQPPSERDVRAVRTATVEPAPERRPWRAHGAIRAADHAHLSFTQGGRLLERTADVGDAVRAGDVVARIDPSPVAHQLRAAEASLAATGARLEQVRRDHARADVLSARGATSVGHAEQVETELVALEASERAAQAQLGEARRSMRETVLRAPFDGVVTAVHREVGEMAAPGAPILSLSGEGAREVEVAAPESLAAAIAIGDDVEASFPLLDRPPIAGRIDRVADAAGPEGLFRIVVALAAVDVRPGSSAVVVFQARQAAPGLTVPVSAVVSPSGAHPAVLVVRDGAARRVPVEVGELRGDRVEVRGMLEAGEAVIVAGTVGLLDGTPVSVEQGP